jgi:serine/threonine-protein kinase
MPGPVADVTLDRALEILEMGERDVEQLLVDGALRAYRKGGNIVFHRQDLADYITTGSGFSAPSPAAPPAAAPPPPGPSPFAPAGSKPQGSSRLKRNTKREDLKRAAMSNGAEKDEGMWSLKKIAAENGFVDDGSEAPGSDIPPDSAASLADGEAAGPGMGPLVAENKSLRARLHAAEEVLSDLQSRLERVNELEAMERNLTAQLTAAQEELIQLEAKVAVYEEQEEGAEGPRWGAPDPDELNVTLKRENADVRGEIAGIKHRIDERDKEIEKLKSQKEDLSTKLSEATSAAESAASASATSAEDGKRTKELEATIEELKSEREMLVLEAQVARELKGEIDRAAELEEKLQTQREVIEAAQSGLVELEEERDELSEIVGELEGRLATAEAEGQKTEGVTAEARGLKEKLAETEKRVAQLDARMSLLRDERTNLAQELEKRDAVAAQLRADVERASSLAEEVPGLRQALNQAKTAAEANEAEAASLKVQMTLKDQLVDQLKSEESDLSELATETAGLREKLAGVEGRSKQAEARMIALRAERDGVVEELAKREGAMSELRVQADRAGSLLGENRNLKEDLEMVRGTASDAESSLAIVQGDKDKLAGELDERGKHVSELEAQLRERARELEAARSQAAAPSAPDGIRAELETLRDQISSQMGDLGHLRSRAASRKRSASDVAAGKKRRISVRRKTGAVAKMTTKPDRLGRYEVGEEQRRTRVGIYYKAEVQPMGGEVSVLVLTPELATARSFIDRFWHEMRVIAELDEKALLGIMDVGETAGFHYVTYEQVDGATLDVELKSGAKMAADRAVSVAATVLDALAVVANNKLVHGDVKAENVILGTEGPVKLAGLGLWRGAEEDAWSLAKGGRIIHYGAPEQITQGARDTRCDIWSAGALLYHMLSGKPPIDAKSIAEAHALVEAGELPKADDLTAAPESLRAAIGKMLAPDPADRFATPDEAAAAIRAAGV